jgi:2-polyprenyl-6-methoxyphenol hydroxylase-like FAD-dependent oxidoreductase
LDRVRGSKVGIVGGSIAGCAAAIALDRLGCDVHLFERSSGALQDRGAGILLPPEVRDELIEFEYLSPDFPTCPLECRLWFVADGTPSGRQLWRQPGSAAASNWGVLWRDLRSRIPKHRYHDGKQLAAVNPTSTGVTTSFVDGSVEEFDVLIGADGYRSIVRERLSPRSRPAYAGYVAWRGTYPEERLAHRAVVDLADAQRAWFLVGFPGGHAIIYTVPNFDDRIDSGHRRINWLVYTPPPPELDFAEPTSVPPGAVTAEHYRFLDEVLETAFASDFQALIRASPVEEISIQPIYDQILDSYVGDRLAVLGDAGAVCRPHTASGTAKTLLDARCLERLGADHATWTDLLAAYDRERSIAGNALVELGRRIGHDQVEQPVSWNSLVSENMSAWTSATLAGGSLYFYGNADA